MEEVIAFDLDGIFLPDIVGFEHNPEILIEARIYQMAPIFRPKGSYYIITGRPREDRKLTEIWMDNFLDNHPKKLFHECYHNEERTKMGETSAHYKSKVINENPEIKMYVESSDKQVDIISSNVRDDVKVVLFSDFLENAFSDHRFWEKN